MTGLLIKDCIALKGFIKIVAVLLAVFVISGLITGSVEVLSSSLMLLCAILPMNALALDDQSKWNAYVCVMPVARRKTVQARYLLIVLMIVSAMALILLSSLIISLKSPVDWGATFSFCVLSACMAMVMVSVMFPLMYKYGVEKSRLILMVAVMGSMIAFTLLSGEIGQVLSASSLPVWLGIPASILLFGASYLASARIYVAKEF